MTTVLLVAAQATGAIIGLVMSVWSEIVYVQAMKDGDITRAERAHLDKFALGLRAGMTLLLFASFGLVLRAYTVGTVLQPGNQTAYWVEMLLALLIITLSWMLSKRKVSFALGSAALFSAWWFIALLALGQLPLLTLTSAILLYLIATAVLYGVLPFARRLTKFKF